MIVVIGADGVGGGGGGGGGGVEFSKIYATKHEKNTSIVQYALMPNRFRPLHNTAGNGVLEIQLIFPKVYEQTILINKNVHVAFEKIKKK